jgi:hypothetical protein
MCTRHAVVLVRLINSDPSDRQSASELDDEDACVMNEKDQIRLIGFLRQREWGLVDGSGAGAVHHVSRCAIKNPRQAGGYV